MNNTELQLTKIPNHVECAVMLCGLRLFQRYLEDDPDIIVVGNREELLNQEYFEDFSEQEMEQINPLNVEALAEAITLQPKRKTKEELDALKHSWVMDACWDIEDTDGFEAHHDELLIWRLQYELKREREENQKFHNAFAVLRELTGGAK